MTLGRVLCSLLLVSGLSGLVACSSLNAGNAGNAESNLRAGESKAVKRPAEIIELSSGQALSLEALAARLATYPIVLLGELHDNSHHHKARARLIQALGQARNNQPPYRLVVEQLPMGGSVRPQGKQPGQPLLEQLREAGFQDEAWAWPLHEPVFRAALSQGMALHGGNLVRGQSMQLFKKGESTLPEKLQGLLSRAPLAEPSLQALNKALVDGHCGQLPEAMLEPMRLVQRATDLALLVTATDYTPAIVIAGNGHVRKDFGIPSLVPAFQRPVRLVTVGFVESELSVDKASMNAAAGVRNDPAWAIYDYVWITPAAEREDPCKGFQMPKR
ncbi:MAG: ChaN family lipoprotein [Burkholderiaceae bacterium]